MKYFLKMSPRNSKDEVREIKDRCWHFSFVAVVCIHLLFGITSLLCTMISLPERTNQLRNPSLLSQRKLILSLVVLIVVSISQIRNVNKVGSSLENGNYIAKKSGTRTNVSAHLYTLQTHSMGYNNTRSMYTWIGNQWVPPKGVPYFLPKQIRHMFRSENTFWLGDSTARQDYQTMYQLMNGDSATPDQLNKHKNKNKERASLPMHCPARRQSEESDGFILDLGQVKGTDQNCYANATGMSTNEADIGKSWSNKTGKFDLGFKGGCFTRFMYPMKTHIDLMKREYSILVISAGIHESERPQLCQNATESDEVVASHALDLLDFLFQEVSGPSLFVIWKTHGTKSNDQSNAKTKRIDQSIVTAARSWFAEQQPPYMDLADFNLEIEERTHGPDRIEGDLKAHWGLEARLLSIEMISDIVRRKQEREIA